ncbi:MAG: cupin domain-containing protein [Rhizobiaceae bacterium]|nr:cupin domain-containing protein [Rhizobiaceae bacterium]
MHPMDLTSGWVSVPGTSRIATKLLSGDFDEPSRKGFRTRYVRIEAGGETFEPYEHEYWEELLIIEGELTSKADGSTISAPGYVLRPPGTPHGPLVSHTGCLLVEFQYFADRAVGMADYLDAKAPSQEC